MDYVPINIAINKALLIGGGATAWQKYQSLKRFNINVTVISLALNRNFKNEKINYKKRKYQKGDLKKYKIAYICLNDEKVKKEIRKEAQKTGTLLNFVDQPSISDFISPAVYKNRNISIAVSSAGKNVKKSIKIRNKIADSIKL
ncbi:bifunctional precorrin-2 dehydrogenase/sirohydrochlorin ferrochelatase [Candidatus Margulisiibacteriota bacterium]